MRRKIYIMIALASVCSFALVSGLSAQVKKDATTGLDRLEGRVQDIDKDKSTLNVLQMTNPNVFWKVVYSDKTKFTYRNAESSLGALKSGQHIICLGKAEGTTFNASRVDIRGEEERFRQRTGP